MDTAALLERIAQLELENKQIIQENEQISMQTRPTTLLELLEKCHNAFAQQMHVESNPKKATTGKTTSVTRKIHPTTLKPWIGFPELRSDIFNRMKAFFEQQSPEDQRCFRSPHQIEGNAANIRGNISFEQDIRNYHSHFPEPFVLDIIKRLIEIPGARSKLHLGTGISFENHTSFNFDSGEFTNPPEKAVLEATVYKVKDTDQLCVKHLNEGSQSVVVVFELKAPHKATRELLTVGLHPFENLRSNVASWVAKQSPPCAKEHQFQRAADKFVAMIVTQTYSYMVRAGLGYGCIMTGHAMVFLHVKKDEPGTVYYYHAEPQAEVDDERETSQAFPYECTEVAQLACFCLLAHSSQRYSQAWCRDIIAKGPRWELKIDQPDLDVAIEAAQYERPSSVNTPRREITESYRIPAAPHRPKPTKLSKVTKAGCDHREKRLDPEGRSDDSSSSDVNSNHSPTPKPREPTKGQGRQSKTKDPPDSQAPSKSYEDTGKKAYCSQECLKGLAEGTVMDPRCPNFVHHPMHEEGFGHALTQPQLAQLLRQQFAKDFEQCTDLQKRGRTGMLFKVTLASHGYTFVAKGSVLGFVPSSRKEEEIYRLLKKIQGKSIPVHLGSIDLDTPWIEGAFDIVHMLLLSWAGDVVWNNLADDEAGERLIRKQKKRFERKCLMIGICHTDTEYRNILWDASTERIMFVDFDQTIVFDVRSPPEIVARRDLYCDVFGSHEQSAAVEYLAKRQEAALAKQARQSSSRCNQNSTLPVGADIDILCDQPVLVPGWLFTDEQAALGTTILPAVATSLDVPASLSRITRMASSSWEPQKSAPAGTERAFGTSSGRINSNPLYPDSSKDNLLTRIPTLRNATIQESKKSSSKGKVGAVDYIDGDKENNLSEEDKENKPVVDSEIDFIS
ncbi:MAG: hypothetical protein Q9219_006550 [cf. Caloplaca sp. 3 TL-2023]